MNNLTELCTYERNCPASTQDNTCVLTVSHKSSHNGQVTGPGQQLHTTGGPELPLRWLTHSNSATATAMPVFNI